MWGHAESILWLKTGDGTGNLSRARVLHFVQDDNSKNKANGKNKGNTKGRLRRPFVLLAKLPAYLAVFSEEFGGLFGEVGEDDGGSGALDAE